MTEAQLKLWIKHCEGLNLKLYKDTVNKTTIGWGRDIEDCGIRIDEAELMFQNDYKQTVDELEQQDWYVIQPPGVKNALINMNFNIGITKLLKFHDMIKALKQKNYSLAAKEALNSEWATEVHQRAKDIALMISQGQ